MSRRNYLFGIIRAVFEKFGFQPLETPAIENLATLTGKYGDEGDQLLFKILESGDFLKRVKDELTEKPDEFGMLVTRSSKIIREAIEAFYRECFESDNGLDEAVLLFKKKSLYNGSGYAYVDESELSWIENFKNENANDIVSEIYLDLEVIKNYYNPDIHFYFKSFEDRFLIPRLFQDLRRDLLAKQIDPERAKQQIIAWKPNDVLRLISEKGLRYDLTVPFARYVVMNQHLHNFPFKRYQIQPVWRADRPQKGRYREFFQCDADVVGTNSLLCEAEIVLMIKEVFEKLGLADYSIKLNNRKILSGIAELMGAPGKEGPLCVAIDKLDKIGEEKVFQELKERGFGDDVAKDLQPFLQLTGSNAAIIADLEKLLAGSDVGMVGVAELKDVMIMVEGFGKEVPQLAIDPTLARGLSYYTGCIFEVKPTSVQMGSICGGGRYDDLTGMFGLPNVSGVGISFGIDRIYDVLDELNLFPAESLRTSKVLIANFDPASAMKALAVLGKLREGGIAAELFPESTKLKKQFTYAESKGIPFLLMAGESEFASGEFGLKNLQSGEQKTFTIDQIISELR